MRRLILLRHGQAERAAESEIDFERGLTARGCDDARRMGLWLAGQVGRIDLALVSPAARARQTWEEAGAAFIGTPVEHPSAFYAADPTEMLRTAEAAEAETVVVVAHSPGLHVLALRLTEATSAPAAVTSALRSEFPPAAVAVFERGVNGVLTAVAFQAPADLCMKADAR